jgi:hypothetical protein
MATKISSLSAPASFDLRVGQPASATMYTKCRVALGLSEDPRLDRYWLLNDYDADRRLFSCHFSSPEAVTELIHGDSEKLRPHDRIAILGMRGVIVHIPVNGLARVISRGFSYTPTCTVTNTLGEHAVPDTPHHFEFTDYNGGQHAINFADPQTRTTVLSEGCVLRITKFQNQPLITTNRRLDTSQSRWGDSPRFVDLYHQLGGPAPLSLFETAESSKLTHLFMVVHPSLQIASRYDIGAGYLLYLGHVVNDAQYPPTPAEIAECQAWMAGVQLRTPSTGDGLALRFPVPPEASVPMIVTPAALTLEGVEMALTAGASGLKREQLHPDPRLRPGEGVIVQFIDALDSTPKIIRLCSLAYNWRTAVNNNKPNRKFQFVSYYSYVLQRSVIRSSHDESERLDRVFNGCQGMTYTYRQLFPWVAAPTAEEFTGLAVALATAGDITQVLHEWVQANQQPTTGSEAMLFPTTGDPRLRQFANIAACMLMAVPYGAIREVVEFFPKFLEQRNRVLTYLIENYTAFKSLPRSSTLGYVDRQEGGDAGGNKLTDFPAFRDARGDLNVAGRALIRLFTVSAMSADGQPGQTRGRFTPATVAGNSLQNLLYKEAGPSLYSILTAVDRHITGAPVSTLTPLEDVLSPKSIARPSLPLPGAIVASDELAI